MLTVAVLLKRAKEEEALARLEAGVAAVVVVMVAARGK